MAAILDKTRSIFRQLGRSVTKFPVETMLGVAYFILFLFRERWDVSDETFLAFFPLYVLTYSFHRLKLRVPYILSYFLWIPVMLFWKESEWGMGIAWLLAAILLVAGYRSLDDEGFAGNLVHVVRQMVIAFLLGGVLMLLAEAIVGTIDLLFVKERLPEYCYSDPAAFVGFVVIPLLCCILVTDESGGEESRFVDILTDKLLTPALLVYTLILYVYAIWILIQWKLPDGGIAYMVTAFIAVALLVYLLRTRYGNRPVAWFFDHLPLVALPPMVLLWIGTVRRVSDYGLTAQRIYLLALAVLMTVFLLMLLRKRDWNFQPMALILAVAAILLTYIPGISAEDFGIRNQQKRLDRILPEVLVDGKFPKRIDYAPVANDPAAVEALKASYEKAFGAWAYLNHNMPDSLFKEKYGQYGVCLDPSGSYRSAVENDFLGVVNEEYRLQEDVDLEGYTVLVREYDLEMDSLGICFLVREADRKGNASDTLLRCDIRSRLNAYIDFDNPELRQREDRKVLIYENGTYKAVFRRLTHYGYSDYAATVVRGTEMLFKKPE